MTNPPRFPFCLTAFRSIFRSKRFLLDLVYNLFKNKSRNLLQGETRTLLCNPVARAKVVSMDGRDFRFQDNFFGLGRPVFLEYNG